MTTHRFSKYFFLLLSAMLVTAWIPTFVHAEDATPVVKESESLTQGQAALIISRRLGLLTGATAPTQAQAIQLLTTRNIAPKGGWDADALLKPGELARLLVQALGLESELSNAQIAGDNNQPYIDLLIEKYGVDFSDLRPSVAVSGSVPGKTGVGYRGDSSSDPLLTPAIPENNLGEIIPVSQNDLNKVLNAIVGTQGNGGQVGGAKNMTPSAP